MTRARYPSYLGRSWEIVTWNAAQEAFDFLYSKKTQTLNISCDFTNFSPIEAIARPKNQSFVPPASAENMVREKQDSITGSIRIALQI
jgi:hypothetical protein